MSKKAGKLLAVALASVSALSMVACGGTGGDTPPVANDASTLELVVWNAGGFKDMLNGWKPAEVKAAVTIDDFGKMDIRVATILECTKVPKADKLLQFKLDDGTGTPRTIVSGIAKYYTEPEKLIGRQVCFIANFPPRKLKGVESQGMILSAEDKDGRLVLLTPSDIVAPGCSIG